MRLKPMNFRDLGVPGSNIGCGKSCILASHILQPIESPGCPTSLFFYKM